MQKKKPSGVTVFGILLIIFTVINIIAMTFGLIVMGFLAGNLDTLGLLEEQTASLNLNYSIGSGIYSLIISIFGLTAGIGVLSLKPWARKLLLILSVVIIVGGVINLILMGSLGMYDILIGSVFSFIIGVIFYGLILWYFNTKKVKEAFS